jgi:hypothetical protein
MRDFATKALKLQKTPRVKFKLQDFGAFWRLGVLVASIFLLLT